jgi:hypothetical protein
MSAANLDSTMAFVTHVILENDPVVLREPVGTWPAGTCGAVISVYDEAVLIEIVGRDGATRDTVAVPAGGLQISNA